MYILYFHCNCVCMCVCVCIGEGRQSVDIRGGSHFLIFLQFCGPAARWTDPLQWSSHCSHWVASCDTSHNGCCLWHLSGPEDATYRKHKDGSLLFQQSTNQAPHGGSALGIYYTFPRSWLHKTDIFSESVVVLSEYEGKLNYLITGN